MLLTRVASFLVPETIKIRQPCLGPDLKGAILDLAFHEVAGVHPAVEAQGRSVRGREAALLRLRNVFHFENMYFRRKTIGFIDITFLRKINHNHRTLHRVIIK
jgi:hypothetical protein